MAVEATKRISGLAYDLMIRQFTLHADVKRDLGGTDSAPDPHDYVQAALAACTAITVQMYANRKKIPLEDINVRVHITAEGEENRIAREMRFIGPLTDEQKEMLFAVAEKCPLHKFLSRGAKIESRFE